MRGTLSEARTPRPELGIIPAYAGNTRLCNRFHIVTRDHPRVCGEHCCGMAWFIATTGSSPRMRGTHCNRCRKRWFPEDHPRVCGEHLCLGVLFRANTGSSPRMRGTLRLERIRAQNIGIIPAYAGNTSSKVLLMRSNWDHPRVCGEHITYAVEGATSQGSSPRMRGTLG